MSIFNQVHIHPANINDLDNIRQLYYDTITTINTKDYNEKQVSVWASGYNDIKKWEDKINQQHFFIAEIEVKVVGFGSITDDGYIDYLFTHKDFQRQGIASAS